MGGSGSGRWPCLQKKGAVDSFRQIDVREWNRRGLLNPGTTFNWIWWNSDGARTVTIRVCAGEEAVILLYDHQSNAAERQEIRERIPLDRTPCQFGGSRPWFRCPGIVDGQHCRRRVAILYGAGPYFLCRHCYDLAYPSQREDKSNRLVRKAQKIRRALGGSGGLDEPFPPKPRGMHWKTYRDLEWEARVAEHDSWIALAQRFRAKNAS